MIEYYWIDDARYSPIENKNRLWSVEYISSECSGVKYFNNLDEALAFIKETKLHDGYSF